MKFEDRDILYLQRMIEYCERIRKAKERFGSRFEISLD